MGRKWRPTLPMVVAAMIAIALLLPLSGIVFFRLLENQLVRNTEAELIAQSAAISASMSAWLEAHPSFDADLGHRVEKERLPDTDKLDPTLPQIDLNTAQVLPPRPAAENATARIATLYEDAGAFLTPIMLQTQKATLAGFRVLDFNGTVIAGRQEVGQSLAHVSEVSQALKGSYASVLRERQIDNPQPIYSISRGTAVRLFAATPVIVGDRLAGVVYASRTPSNVVKELYFLRDRLIYLVLGVLVAAAIMVLIFSRAISGPIRHLADRAAKIGMGDRSAIGPMPHYGSREVHQLSRELMDMSERLFARNDYIATFAAHVSHELKSPLTSIRGAVELIRDETMSEAERRQFLDNIAGDAERGTKLLDRLRTLAQADNTLVGGTSRLSDCLSDADERFPELEISVSGDVALPVSQENMQIVLDNLLDNARQHGATQMNISAESADSKFLIVLQDNGPGISDGNADQIFDLFFTTRRQAGGTGVGLSIVSSILKAHKGSISLRPSDKGACFVIEIPNSDDAS